MILSLGGEVSLPFARDVWGHTDYRTISRYTHLAEKLKSDQEKISSLDNLDERLLKPL